MKWFDDLATAYKYLIIIGSVLVAIFVTISITFWCTRRRVLKRLKKQDLEAGRTGEQYQLHPTSRSRDNALDAHGAEGRFTRPARLSRIEQPVHYERERVDEKTTASRNVRKFPSTSSATSNTTLPPYRAPSVSTTAQYQVERHHSLVQQAHHGAAYIYPEDPSPAYDYRPPMMRSGSNGHQSPLPPDPHSPALISRPGTAQAMSRSGMASPSLSSKQRQYPPLSGPGTVEPRQTGPLPSPTLTPRTQTPRFGRSGSAQSIHTGPGRYLSPSASPVVTGPGTAQGFHTDTTQHASPSDGGPVVFRPRSTGPYQRSDSAPPPIFSASMPLTPTIRAHLERTGSLQAVPRVELDYARSQPPTADAHAHYHYYHHPHQQHQQHQRQNSDPAFPSPVRSLDSPGPRKLDLRTQSPSLPSPVLIHAPPPSRAERAQTPRSPLQGEWRLRQPEEDVGQCIPTALRPGYI